MVTTSFSAPGEGMTAVPSAVDFPSRTSLAARALRALLLSADRSTPPTTSGLTPRGRTEIFAPATGLPEASSRTCTRMEAQPVLAQKTAGVEAGVGAGDSVGS